MISVFYSVAVSLIYSLSCLGFGWLVASPFSRWTQPAEADAAQDLAAIASAYLLGGAFCAALLTIIGLLGMLDVLTVALTLVPGVVAFVVGALRRPAVWGRIAAAFASLRSQPFWVTLVVALLIVVALGFAVAAWFTPPKGDAAAFYLVYPKIIAAAGALFPMPGLYEGFSMIGLSAEYHFAALLVLADVGAAKLFMFPVALASAALLAGLVRICGGGLVAIVLSCAVLLTSSTFHLYVFDGKVDLLAAAFGLAAAYWLIRRPVVRADYSAYALSGLFAGLATVSKFSYVLALGASLLVLLFWRTSVAERATRGAWSYLKLLLLGGLVMAATTLVGWLPHVLKNSVLFHAPLAPFIGASGSGDIFNQVWFSASTTWQIVLTYPLALVFGRYPMQGGGLSFLLLCFLPLLFWGSRSFGWHRSKAGVLALAGLAALVVWVALRPSVIAPRYILASLLLFVPLIVIKVEELLRDGSGPAFLRIGVVGSVLAAIAASCWQLLPLPSALAAAARGTDPTCLMASPECIPLRQLSGQATPGDRMLVATYYAYWLDASYLQCRDVGNELASAAGQPDLMGWLQRRAFRYVIIDPLVHPQLASALADLDKTQSDVSELPQPDGGVTQVYQISPGAAPDVRCVNTSRDRWVLEDIAQ